MIDPYRAACHERQDALREDRGLVYDRATDLARDQNRVDRIPPGISPPLELAEERDLPCPALLEIKPPEIVERRPTDHIGSKVIRPEQ